MPVNVQCTGKKDLLRRPLLTLMHTSGDTRDTSPLLLASGGTDDPADPVAEGGREREEEEDQLFQSSSSSEWGGYQKTNYEQSFI